MKGMIAWFADNHVAANLLMAFLIVAGIVTLFTIKLEVFPEFELEKISISVEYRGASPSEVEEGVIRQIEEKVAGLEGIRRIDSTAREGVASIIIEVMEGWDVQKLLDDVKSEVDRIVTLPDESEKPQVSQITSRSNVLMLAVYGDASEATLKNLAERIKDDLTTLPDITVAELFGVRDQEIHIEVDEATLRRYGLTLAKVAQAVANASLDLPAGSVKTAAGEVLVRAKGKKYRAKQYADVPVLTNPDGSKVLLGEIAKLSEGFRDVDIFARFQGKPAALIQVYRVADQSALTVADEAKRFLEQVRPTLPEGVHIDYLSDRSKVLKSRIELLLRNMALGLVLVIVMLGLFLNARLSFWVTLGIPISFLAGIWALPWFDVSINMISLFAFIMVLGIVVDDAIVVGEHVFTLREKGLPRLKAAVEGTVAIGRPVIFSVLTTVAAFWPLMEAGGIMGKIMRNIPIVVILVLLASLVECLLILPAHLAHSRLTSPGEAKREKFSAAWLRRLINGPYQRFLDMCLRWRYATIAAGVAVLLLAVGTVAGGWLKFTLMPKVESDVLTMSLTMPAGTPVEQTVRTVNKIETGAMDALREADKEQSGDESLLQYVVSLIGVQTGGHGPRAGGGDMGGHLAQVFVEMLEGEKRDLTATELINRWRKRVGPVQEAEEITYSGELFSAGKAIEVHLSAPDEATLRRAADELKEVLSSYAGVYEIADSFLPGKREMQLELKPSARALGLTLNDLATQVRHALYGAEALRLQRDQDEVRVLVRYPESERRSLHNIEAMRIRTPDGQEVPFSQVAQVTMEQGYTKIERANRRQVIKVYADVNEDVANASEIRRRLMTEVLPRMAADHTGLRYTQEGEGREEQESLDDVFSGFILALFLIYTLLAVPFRSFTQPFIVMSAIPFGIVGALAGHLLMGINLSMLSLFGIVGLTGVVVNDSLVLIHQANRLREEEGLSALEAVSQAGPLRFRAVILTSLTTFAGLAPMIAERSLQAQFLIPMAVSLGFGVLFATGITLVLIPCGYLLLEDIHDLGGRLKATLLGRSRADHADN